MSRTILVTGATGTVGSEVVRQLAAADCRLRAGVHTPSKAAALEGSGAEVVAVEYRDAEIMKRALEGADKLFLVIDDVPDHGELAGRLAELAASAGVEHLVKLSAMGADGGSYTLGDWHGDAERAIRDSGVPWTFLRPNSFMQNFATYFRPRDGKIYLPLGDGEVSYVDARDVAAVAAAALTGEGHAGKTYELSGPEAISVGRVAEVLSGATGVDVRYVDVPEELARQGMKDFGSPEWFIEGVLEMHRVNKAGDYAAVTGAVEEVTGRPARSFERFVEDFADHFRAVVA